MDVQTFKSRTIFRNLQKSDGHGILRADRITQAFEWCREWFNPQPLTTSFTPRPTRLSGKSRSDSRSDQPQFVIWRRRSTCSCAQQIGDGPDKGGKVGFGHCSQFGGVEVCGGQEKVRRVPVCRQRISSTSADQMERSRNRRDARESRLAAAFGRQHLGTPNLLLIHTKLVVALAERGANY
jgi:hypothetical protein